MKQAILNLKKKLFLIELPQGNIEDVEDVAIKLLGKLTNITESQYQQWVDKFNNGAYRNYKDEYPFYPDFDTDNFFLTAKESFFSYLESQEILFSNPLGEFPTKQNTGLEYGMEYISKVQRWEEAESKIWQLSQTYLFEILN